MLLRTQMGLKPSVFCPKTPAKTRETYCVCNAYFSKTPPTLEHMPPDQGRSQGKGSWCSSTPFLSEIVYLIV